MTHAEFARTIDHTLLKPDSTRRDCRRICEEAKTHGFASACILPAWVADAAEILDGSPVAVCTVIGFPHGIAPTGAKVAEVHTVVADGAKEVDMVINISALKSGSDLLVFQDIEAVVEAAEPGGALVKVIFECALLTDEEKQRACRMCVEAGADFVKTSTGFAGGGATIADVALMKAVVDGEAQIKAAGGIRTVEDALALLNAGADRLGTSAGIALLEAFRGGNFAQPASGSY
ncbi:MAG: deoxyribose-phosphate aldolase [Akkermansiaceae bacterium]|nr:deoxyribose-phosphate aldolase [Armatimonadota bacterium]